MDWMVLLVVCISIVIVIIAALPMFLRGKEYFTMNVKYIGIIAVVVVSLAVIFLIIDLIMNHHLGIWVISIVLTFAAGLPLVTLGITFWKSTLKILTPIMFSITLLAVFLSFIPEIRDQYQGYIIISLIIINTGVSRFVTRCRNRNAYGFYKDTRPDYPEFSGNMVQRFIKKIFFRI